MQSVVLMLCRALRGQDVFSKTKISTKKGPETLWISGQTAVIEGVYILYMPLPELPQEEKLEFVIFFIQFRTFLEYSRVIVFKTKIK